MSAEDGLEEIHHIVLDIKEEHDDHKEHDDHGHEEEHDSHAEEFAEEIEHVI